MYTKAIKFEQYVKSVDMWLEQTLRTTNDAIWLHLQALNLNKNVRKIVVIDIV